MNTKHYIAASAVAFTLLSGSVAFAESDKKYDKEQFGVRIGSFFKNHDKGDFKKWGHKNEADTVVRGEVTGVNGTTLSLRSEGGTVYTINTAGAEFKNGTLASIAAGDVISVRGELDGTILTAETVKEKHAKDYRKKVSAGTVAAVNGSLITLERFGSKGTTTVAVDASTVIKQNGATTTLAALGAGSKIIAFGTTSSATGTLSASFIYILNETWGFLKRAFNR